MSTLWQALILGVMTASYAAGGYWLNVFAKSEPNLSTLVLSICLYLAGNGFYVMILKTNSYGVAVMLSSVMLSLLNLAVASLIFGERLSAQQCVGIVFALLGVTLVVVPGIKLTSM